MSQNAFMSNVHPSQSYLNSNGGALTCWLPQDLVVKLTRQNRDAVWLNPVFHDGHIKLHSVDHRNGRVVSPPKNGFCLVQFGHKKYPLSSTNMPKFGKSPTQIEVATDFSFCTIFTPSEDQRKAISRRIRDGRNQASLTVVEAPVLKIAEVSPTMVLLPQSPTPEPVEHIIVMSEIGEETHVFNIPMASYASFKKLFGKYQLEI